MAWSKSSKGWGAKKKPRKKGMRTNTRKAGRTRYGRRKSTARNRSSSMSQMVCPVSFDGKTVHKARNGNCFIRKSNGQTRFVKKVSASSNRSRFIPGAQSYLRGLKGARKRKAGGRRWRRR